MTKISVVLSINNDYNIEKSLESILNQTITDIEIICIVDSTQTLDCINNYSKNNNIHCIYKSINIGKTLNECLERARGQYIYFMNNSIELTDNDSLQLLYEYGIKNNSNVICATSDKIDSNIKPEAYDITLPLYNNIYLKSFLKENEINFPEFTFNADSIFISKVLANVNIIDLIDIQLYEEKGDFKPPVLKYFYEKEQYVDYFIKTFDILYKNGFSQQLIQYKIKFIDYLTYHNNLNDKNLTRILQQKPQIEQYFDSKEYGIFFIEYIKNPLDEEDVEYKLIKECIFEENMLKNEFIEVSTLQEFIKLQEEHDKSLMAKNSYRQLLNIERYTEMDKREVVSSRNKVRNKLVANVKIKNEIFSSNSWKLTEYLRLFKRKIRPGESK